MANALALGNSTNSKAAQVQRVIVLNMDMSDPLTGEVQLSEPEAIAVWLTINLDSQVFFCS